jgi:hypothetical protein
MKRLLMSLGAGAVLSALAFVGWLAAQPAITSQTLTGLEAWPVAIGGPGGPSIFVTSGQIRNSQGVSTTALATGTISLANTTATLITTAIVSGALTVNTPTLPFDGEILEIANGSGSNNTATITLTASGTQTVNGGAVATQASQASAEWRYVLATTTWYRLR